jgi:hypothetical protein
MVLVVVNGNNKPGKFDLSRLNGELSDWKRTEISEVITGQKADLSGKELNLPAKGILIFDFRR